MGDRRKRALRVQFDGKLRLEFHGAKITSDAGLLPFRELDEAFSLSENASAVLPDPRHRKNMQHTMLAMPRQSVYGRLAGYEDVNVANRLRIDPAMRRVVGGRATEKHWSLTTLREKLIKIGAKVVTHSRYGVFQMAKVVMPGELFARILEPIPWFGVPPALGQRGGSGDRTTGWRFAGGGG